VNALRLSSPETRPFDAFRVYQTSFRGEPGTAATRDRPGAGPGPQSHGIIERPRIWIDDGGGVAGRIGDPARSTRIDQVFAYVGLDLQVKQSGKWKEQTKLSKHGSGRVRRILYLAALRSIHQEHPLWGFLSAFGGSWDEKGYGVPTPTVEAAEPLDDVQRPGNRCVRNCLDEGLDKFYGLLLFRE
jgi:hypothetical protein